MNTTGIILLTIIIAIYIFFFFWIFERKFFRRIKNTEMWMYCECDSEDITLHYLYGKRYGGILECQRCKRRKPAKIVD